MQELLHVARISLQSKLKDYSMLMKLSLSIMVVFSSVMSYLLSPKIVLFNWEMVSWLFISGIFITGSANTMNQIIEKKSDAKMKRTSNRPLATGRMTEEEAWIFAIVTGIIGISVLALIFNVWAATLALSSMFLYAFVYTPLKKKGKIALFVGAVSGSAPCLIGWVAGNDYLSLGGIVLFTIQFLWQFPHFYAISWLAKDDYKKLGFRFLPFKNQPNRRTAMDTIFYSIAICWVAIIPFFIQMTDWRGTTIVLLASIYLLTKCIVLYNKLDNIRAKQLLLTCYLYIPIMYFSLLIDKI